MRTTLTLDSDVTAQLRAMISQRHQPLKVVVNEALRSGLSTMKAEQQSRPRFETPVLDLGRPLVNLDCTSEVLAMLEELDRK